MAKKSVQKEVNKHEKAVILESMDKILQVPNRLLIISLLYVVEKAEMKFLLTQSGLTWGNLSSHTTKLEEVGYVDIEKKFKGKKPQTWVSLTKEGRLAFETYRENMKKLLEGVPK